MSHEEQVARIEAEFEAANYILDLDRLPNGTWAGMYRHRDSSIGTRIPFVARSKLPKDSDCVIARGVIDKNVLVAIAADRSDRRLDPAVQLLDVLLLVVAGSDYGYRPHT